MIVLVAVLAPWLGTVDPTKVQALKRGREPSAQFWFGTDMRGRDVYSRVIYGARVSLIVGIAAAMVSATGFICQIALPSAIMLPQLGMIGAVPAPMKDRVASITIAEA